MQMLVIGTYLYSFTFWIEPWATEFDVSPTRIMIVPSIYLYANAIALLFMGKYLDRLPHRLIVSTGLGLFCLSMLLISVSSSLGVIFLIYLFVVPLSVACAGPVAAITLVSQVFDRKRGLAIGIVGLGSSFGGMLVPHLVAYMISEWGWRTANQVLAGGALILILISILGLRYDTGDGGRKHTNRQLAREPSKTFFRQKSFWLCILASAGAYFVFMAVQFNMAPITFEIGFEAKETAFIIALFTAGMLTGKIAVGFLSDYMDPRYIFLVVCLCMIAALAIITVHPADIAVLTAFFLFGSGAGGVMPIKAILIARIFGPQRMGQVMGLSAPFLAIYSLGPVTATYLRSISDGYGIVLLVLIGILIVTSPVVLLLPKKTGVRSH